MVEINIPQLLAKKRDGLEYSSQDIEDLVGAIARRELQECQVGAFLMAAYIRGLTMTETSVLTKAMVQNGDSFKWPSDWAGKVVDKHSTGGVGDKVSLPLAPLLAALGFRVPMLSGRGLGHTGGTCDKLEAIPGFRVDLSMDEIVATVEKVGCCITASTPSIVPVDKTLYAIRDVTATVSSASLIAASIVSKKGAETLDHLVLDCKFGSAGYFGLDEGAKFGKMMSDLCASLGVECTVCMTRMDEPIGYWVGNSAEIVETIEYLNGKTQAVDLHELVTACATRLLLQSKTVTSESEALRLITEALVSGKALKKFEEMCVAQGVSPAIAASLCSGDFSHLPQSKTTVELVTNQAGHVEKVDGMKIAEVLRELGAGRMASNDVLDMTVALNMHHTVGAQLSKGATWAELYFGKKKPSEEQIERLSDCISISQTPVEREKLVHHYFNNKDILVKRS